MTENYECDTENALNFKDSSTNSSTISSTNSSSDPPMDIGRIGLHIVKKKVRPEKDILDKIDNLENGGKDNIKRTDKKKKKNLNKRCNFDECNKKFGLSPFNCKCGLKFCAMHRLSFEHNCEFDFKNEGKDRLSNQLVPVIASKIKKI